MQVVLAMFRADGQHRSFSVSRETTVIGRRQDCDLRIPLGEVSRKHCRIMQEGGHLRVEDLGSSNGTYVNGQRVQQAELQPGDSLQVGPVVFVMQIDGFPPEEDLRPISREEVEATAASSEEPAPAEPAAAPAGDDEAIAFDPLDALSEPKADDSAFELAAEEEMAQAALEMQAEEEGGAAAPADAEPAEPAAGDSSAADAALGADATIAPVAQDEPISIPDEPIAIAHDDAIPIAPEEPPPLAPQEPSAGGDEAIDIEGLDLLDEEQPEGEDGEGDVENAGPKPGKRG